MKYQKEFEEMIAEHPNMLKGNTLSTTSVAYGVPLASPEYCSSWVQQLYLVFCEKFEALEEYAKSSGVS